ncbi:Uncharacterised protein [Bordetella pertussis]|nr:Uncharacterised protein [Bordetella pertussis]
MASSTISGWMPWLANISSIVVRPVKARSYVTMGYSASWASVRRRAWLEVSSVSGWSGRTTTVCSQV